MTVEEQMNIMADKVEGAINDYTGGITDLNKTVVDIVEYFLDLMFEIETNWATDVKTVRDVQCAYFASKKENRYGDRKLLAQSKEFEAQLDKRVEIVLNAKS